MKRIWARLSPDEIIVQQLCKDLELSPLVARILVQRGLVRTEEVIDFLRPTLLNLASPFCFTQMQRAVERLAIARERGEKVLVYGDYDVDGVTSTALVYKVLIDLGFKAVTYIPHRQEEGYGLHREVVAKAVQAEVKIIITVDCGISAWEEVDMAREYGIDTIITDHHEPPAALPEAYAIINPKVLLSGYPFRELAGVGVAFKLAQALLQELGNEEAGIHSEIELMDLVALGTIADIVPLQGENRIMVYYGLQQMEKTVHLGLGALLEECGLRRKPFKVGQIAFMVAPRINAAGRMDSARAGLELLLTGDPERARELARRLTQENLERQRVEKEIFAEVVSRLEKDPLPKVIVMSAPHWHHGVIGIVASRLVERYYRPVFLIAQDGDEGKGSARGISGYHVLEELTSQAGLLTKFGGHRQAAGFSLPAENIELLREGLNTRAAELPATVFHEVLQLDGEVSLSLVSEMMYQELEQLAPLGFGNPGPVLTAKAVPVREIRTVGSENSHLKFRLGLSGEWEGIAFRQGSRLNEVSGEKFLDLAFSLDLNTFQGERRLQLMIRDFAGQAEWQENVPDMAIAEVAAGVEEGWPGQSLEWLDWRNDDRQTWVRKVHNILRQEGDAAANLERVIVWDLTGNSPKLMTLAGFLNEAPEISRIEQEFSGAEEYMLGIIAGVPIKPGDLILGLDRMLSLGIKRIAWAESGILNHLELQKYCGFLAREELGESYRRLRKKVKEGKNFFRLSVSEAEAERKALKIFEELGILSCQGGTDMPLLQWLPVEGKLDLDSSIRYTYGKRCWENAGRWQSYLATASLTNLRQQINDWDNNR